MSFFLYLFVACALGFLLIRPSISISRRAGLLDYPHSSGYKIHHSVTPRAGGVVLFPTVMLISFFAGVLQDSQLRSLALSAIVIFIAGIWDDRKPLTASRKFVGQLIATAILIQGGLWIQITSFPSLNIALTVFWVLGVTNAFNLIDSKDGLAVGIAILVSIFFLSVTQEANQPNLAQFCAILLGACLAVFYFNSEPAVFFLGDSGAQFLGFMLAGISIAYTPPGLPQASSWFVPILLLGVPIFDTTLVTISRLKRKLPVFRGNRDHTYHRLVSLGMPSQRATLTLHIATIWLGCLAFIALKLPPIFSNAIFAACLLCGLIALALLEHYCPMTDK